MTALEDARTSAQNARRLIDALEDVADFGEDAFADLKQEVNQIFNLLAPFAAPPTDDEREALAAVVVRAQNAVSTLFHYWTPESSGTRSVVGAVLAAGFRRQGPITDAQVDAAYGVLLNSPWRRTGMGSRAGSRETLRAALEAARNATI